MKQATEVSARSVPGMASRRHPVMKSERRVYLPPPSFRRQPARIMQYGLERMSCRPHNALRCQLTSGMYEFPEQHEAGSPFNPHSVIHYSP